MKIGLESLKLRTADERWQMYKNALAKPDHPDAKTLISLIDDNQLSMTDRGGFPAEHPTIRAIYDVCFSTEGRQAAIRATEEGLPAMEYVDPLLSTKVPGYVVNLDTHTWAGEYVAQAMETSGYKRTLRRGKLSAERSAKSAMIFAKR